MRRSRKIDKDLAKAAFLRAIRTMFQTSVGVLTMYVASITFNIYNAIAIILLTGAYSLIFGLIFGLPETETLGTLLIDETGDVDIYRLDVDIPLGSLSTYDKVLVKVDPDADLTQE